MKSFEVFPRRYGSIPYVFLAYLTFPIIHVWMESGMKRMVGLCLLAVFLVAYRESYKAGTDGKLIGWSFLQLAIILVLTEFYQTYNLLLAFYVSNFLGWIGEKRLFRLATGAFGSILIGYGVLMVAEYGIGNGFFAFPFIIVMALTPIALRNSAERNKLEEQLDEANERIRELSRQEERVRIARDLHDTMGHTLSLITLKSQVIQRVQLDPDRVVMEAKAIEETSRSALKQVRELVSDMRSSSIAEELGQMEMILSAASIEMQKSIPEPLPELSPLKQNIVGMCIREVATNIVRHSYATRCAVTIKETDATVEVAIKDDGIGIGASQWGNGLNGMMERLALVEGTLTIDATEGTQVALTIPIPITSKGVEVG